MLFSGFVFFALVFSFLLSLKVESVAGLTHRDTDNHAHSRSHLWAIQDRRLTAGLWSVGGSRSAEREPTQTRGEHASSTQMVDLNPGLWGNSGNHFFTTAAQLHRNWLNFALRHTARVTYRRLALADMCISGPWIQQHIFSNYWAKFTLLFFPADSKLSHGTKRQIITWHRQASNIWSLDLNK